MQKVPYVFPVVGGRKPEHLLDNIKALDIALSDAHIKKIEEAAPFYKGNMYLYFVCAVSTDTVYASSRHLQGDGSQYNFFQVLAGHFDKWPAQPALRPRPSQ